LEKGNRERKMGSPSHAELGVEALQKFRAGKRKKEKGAKGGQVLVLSGDSELKIGNLPPERQDIRASAGKPE